MTKYTFKHDRYGVYVPEVPFSSLVGRTLSAVDHSDEHILFVFEDGANGMLLIHDQDCCEDVRVEDIVGYLGDLVGTPILRAEESSGDAPQEYGSGTWTYYKLGTVKGDVDIRWIGTSNGYYSEGVSVYPTPVQKVEEQ